MNTSGIRKGDIVMVDVKGATGIGRVAAPKNDQGQIEVVPFQTARNTVSYVPRRFVTARQITGHYRRMKGSR